MNKKDLEKFKNLLIKKKEEILTEIRHIAEDALRTPQKETTGDTPGYALHMADVATDTFDREFFSNLASNERTVLYEIEETLRRIDEGVYGLCQRCGRRISKMRLRAIPYAKFCRNCQQEQERQLPPKS